MNDPIERYQLEVEGHMLVTFATEEAMILFIQTELPREIVEAGEYLTRTLH